jgi:hypothetical protein
MPHAATGPPHMTGSENDTNTGLDSAKVEVKHLERSNSRRVRLPSLVHNRGKHSDVGWVLARAQEFRQSGFWPGAEGEEL